MQNQPIRTGIKFKTNGTDRVFSSKNFIFFMTVTLNQSAKTIIDSPLSMSRFSFVTSSGKYSSSGSTRSNTPKIKQKNHINNNVLFAYHCTTVLPHIKFQEYWHQFHSIMPHIDSVIIGTRQSPHQIFSCMTPVCNV